MQTAQDFLNNPLWVGVTMMVYNNALTDAELLSLAEDAANEANQQAIDAIEGDSKPDFNFAVCRDGH